MLWEYPIDLVFNLYQAEIANRQEELRLAMAGQALAVSRAIENALDLLFNKGKGRILETWLKAMDSPAAAQPGKTMPVPKPERTQLSPEAKAFFSGLPVKTKKG